MKEFLKTLWLPLLLMVITGIMKDGTLFIVSLILFILEFIPTFPVLVLIQEYNSKSKSMREILGNKYQQEIDRYNDQKWVPYVIIPIRISQWSLAAYLLWLWFQ